MDVSFALSQVESKDVKICSQTESCIGMFQHGAVFMESDILPKVGRTWETFPAFNH